VEIERVKLAEAIARVLPAVGKKETFEQATKIVFHDGHVAAYNDEISIFDRQPDLAGIEGAVDGRQLCDLLGKISTDAVTLAVDGSRLSIRSGRVRADFDMLPVALPLDEIDRSGEEGDPLPADFCGALGLVAAACARDMSRPVLTCVCLGGDRVEAADGFRAARSSFEGASLPSLLLPVTAAEVLVGYPVERVAASDSGEWARFTARGGDTVIFARVFSGRFPDLDGLYEVEGHAVVLPSALDKVLDRAGIFTRREHRIDEVVHLSMRRSQVTVSAEYEGGRFTEVIRSDGQDVDADFSIHPDFLSEALKTGTSCVVGGDRVLFSGEHWRHVIALRG